MARESPKSLTAENGSMEKTAAPLLQTVGDEAFGFRVRQIRELQDVGARMWRMEFVKNGAALVWIENADRNKTFAVSFRTQPEDDTGVAHIIEHSVLCGSEKFPINDPFNELHKSSLATYLNACTWHDYTSYPVCTCNERDLLNLAEVYLDAVFAPLSVKNDWAMPQERNIVLNEMKGAMSSPPSIAAYEMSKMLFPSNTYGRNFGVDPAVIPTLTMEKYREFYNRFYHPSNACIFLCGDIDIGPILKLVGSYLGRYERREVPPCVPFQVPVTAEKTIEYPCDTIADRTRICEGWVFGMWHDSEKAEAMDVVCDILAESNDSPLAKELLDAGVCESFSMGCYGGYQNQIRASFVNVHDGRIDDAKRIFRETLERLVRDGFDGRQIAAKLDRLEFEWREHDPSDFGLDALSAVRGSWLYGGDPAGRFSKHIDSLRRLNGTGYYERLAVEAILNNPHHATLVMTPKDTGKIDGEALSMPMVKAPEDDPAALAKLPRLHLADIPQKGEYTEWTVEKVNGVDVVHPLVASNGITYATLAFAVDDLTDDELHDLALLGHVLTNVPAGGCDVPTLRRELDSGLGLFKVRAWPIKGGVFFAVEIEFLESHAENALCLVRDILLSSDFSKAKEIDCIRRQRMIAFERKLLRGGKSVAQVRAGRGLSVSHHASEVLSGLSQYRHLKSGTCGDLAKLAAKVFVRGRLSVSIANPHSADFVRRLIGIVPNGEFTSCAGASFVRGVMPSDGFSTKGRGVSTAMCACLPDDVAYSGAFSVAGNILSHDFLWNRIRGMGGAYGCGFIVTWFGDIQLYSYRDPCPSDTLGVFAKCGRALREFVKTGRSFESYQLSESVKGETIQSVGASALLAFMSHLCGHTVDDMQRIRSEILHTTADDLLRFADILDKILPDATRCVIGEEALVRKCGLPEIRIE